MLTGQVSLSLETTSTMAHGSSGTYTSVNKQKFKIRSSINIVFFKFHFGYHFSILRTRTVMIFPEDKCSVWPPIPTGAYDFSVSLNEKNISESYFQSNSLNQ